MLAQRYDSNEGCTVPEDPDASAIVFPRANSVLIFDGTLAHGVLEGPGTEMRMTLLVNWWDRHPEVCMRRAAHYIAH